jgi:lysophospholipase L1-like esterase
MVGKLRLLSFFLVLILIDAGCTVIRKTPVDILSAVDLRPYGRFQINEQKELELISSAVHFGFSFEGDSCVIKVRGTNPIGHNFLQYELDGIYQKRIRINGSTSTPLTIRAKEKGKHIVWIYKATEAHTGAINVLSVSGKRVVALSRPASLPLIEFIGNSITCGAAADASEVACGTGEYHDQHNAYMAYGPRLARLLKTNFILSSVSGIGIYRNWAGENPPMPKVYEHLNFSVKSGQWDFKRYTPQVVSIALGTNDLSNGDGKIPRKSFDTTECINSYVKFIQVVKSKYPKSKIALLNSPMIGGLPGQTLDQCILSVKQKVDALYPSDYPVATYFFKPVQAHGCTGHPSIEDHEILATELLPFFRKLLF